MPSPAMIPPERYVDEALAALRPLDAVPVPLEDAHGLVLAEDVTAALPVPPWTNSAMDGYALRAEDAAGAAERAPVVLPVSGDVPAGSAPAPLPPGTAMRIMTGAMLPEGADAVVRVEDTDQSPGPRPLPGAVAIHAAPGIGLNVRRAGEGCAAGDPVMRAGTVLSATAISALASVGRDEVLAARARGSPSYPPAPSSSPRGRGSPRARSRTRTPCCWPASSANAAPPSRARAAAPTPPRT
ncbi:molybdopterin biosynthesis protein MoeA [Actinomyces denticolens]|uniref:hypothetical protein n=1 Tax=Actinomyces denticolens TaxID=52767 RepID=UPI0009C8E18A|nr:hypothetical protein [Actinomyces denticolens]GAV93420.1 molybdopterin biosynthesis protein MoeA [Actinomyces denticolens]